MEIFNRVTLKKNVKQAQSVNPITLRAIKSGRFTVSKGIYELLDSPSYIQILRQDDKLYIGRDSGETGIRLNENPKNKSISFGCSELLKMEVFQPAVIYIAFTEPEYINLAGVGELANMLQVYQLIAHK